MNPLKTLTTSTSSSSLAIDATTAAANASGGVDVFMVSMTVLALLVMVGAVILVLWGLRGRVHSFRTRTRTVDVPSLARQYPPSHLPAQLNFKAGNLIVSSLAKPTSVQPPIYKPSSGYEKLLDPNGMV